MPTLDEVIESVKNKETVLPTGLYLMHKEDDWRIMFIQSKITNKQEAEEALTFMVGVTSDIPEAVTQELGLELGSYLVSTEKMDADEVFGGAVMKITGYLPLLNNVLCVGILEDHACHGFEGGWHLMPPTEEPNLVQLIAWDCYKVMDEAGMKEYCVEHEMPIDEQYL